MSIVLLLNTRFKCLAPLEVSDSVCSIIVKDKCLNELNMAPGREKKKKQAEAELQRSLQQLQQDTNQRHMELSWSAMQL